MTKLLYFLRAALSGLTQRPFVHAVAALTIGVALFGAALASYGLRAGDKLLANWGEDVEVTLYLKPGVDDAKAMELAAKLGQASAGTARFVSSDAALTRLKEELGEDGAVLKDLPKNPLPSSIEVKPRLAGDAVARLAEDWEKLPEVQAVDYGREWVDRLESVTRAARNAGAIVFLAILIAAIVVVAATLQLGIYARREEIEIQKLVGATNSFVKAPFLLEGMLQGLLGAAIACLALVGFERYVGPKLGEALSFAAGSLAGLPLLDAATAGRLVAGGVLLGFVGSLVAVGRFLRT